MSADLDFDDADPGGIMEDDTTIIPVLGWPLNRFIAFLGPYIAAISGAVASWLLVHVHVLGLFHFQHDGLAAGVAQGIVFLVTALLTWAGHQKWLTGHQAWEQQKLNAQLYPANEPLPADDPSVTLATSGSHPDGGEYNPDEITPPTPPGV